jgi:hypothetical protein
MDWKFPVVTGSGFFLVMCGHCPVEHSLQMLDIIPLEVCGFLLSSQNINVITQLIIITVEEKCKVVNLLLLQITHFFNKNSIHPQKKSFRRNVRQNKIGTSSMEPMQARSWIIKQNITRKNP